MESTRHRVLIVEDHAITAWGYQHAIDATPDFAVCGLARTVQEIPSAVEGNRPDVVVMDLFLPDEKELSVDFNVVNQRGLSQGLRLKGQYPEIGVLFVSALILRPTIQIILKSKHQGGLGFVAKRADVDEFLFALRQVAQGKRHVDFGTNRTLLDSQPSANMVLGDVFTPREKEVLIGIAEGHKRETIGQHLSISKSTVDRNLGNIRFKLRERRVRVGGSSKYTLVRLAQLALAIEIAEPLTIDFEGDLSV